MSRWRRSRNPPAVTVRSSAQIACQIAPHLAVAENLNASTMPEATVSLKTGLTQSYTEQGDRAGPVLVLLPGPTDSWRSYGSVLERLPESIRAVAVSHRGHGDSDKPVPAIRLMTSPRMWCRHFPRSRG